MTDHGQGFVFGRGRVFAQIFRHLHSFSELLTQKLVLAQKPFKLLQQVAQFSLLGKAGIGAGTVPSDFPLVLV